MKWIGIAGSWRKSCPELQVDLDREVSLALQAGNGIVTGGALGVDYQAINLALKHTPDGSQLKVFLPTTLQIYATHYRKRAGEGVITRSQAEALIYQREIVNNLDCLIVNTEHSELNKTAYYSRNTEVMNASDALLAFQVNGSAGTQDAIDKALQKGMPVTAYTYSVE
jgi:hypothetical protein